MYTSGSESWVFCNHDAASGMANWKVWRVYEDDVIGHYIWEDLFWRQLEESEMPPTRCTCCGRSDRGEWFGLVDGVMYAFTVCTHTYICHPRVQMSCFHLIKEHGEQPAQIIGNAVEAIFRKKVKRVDIPKEVWAIIGAFLLQ